MTEQDKMAIGIFLALLSLLLLGFALLSAPFVYGATQTVTIKYEANAKGWYDTKTGLILIDPSNMTAAQYGFVAMHEFGHVLFSERLPTSAQKLYGGVHNDAKSFVTEYARDCRSIVARCNPTEEDFADSYASVWQWRFNAGALTDDRQGFFNQWVFS